MRIAYVDDTKQRGRRRDMGQLVALGAAIFDEEQIQPFDQAFRAAYDEFDVPHDVELKWSNSQRSNWWAESEDRKAKQTPLRRRVLELAQAHDVGVIVVVWDTNGGIASAGGEGPEDAVITFMFERISAQLENNGDRGIIVFDKPGGTHREEASWLTDRAEMVRVGTDYVKPNAIVTQILTAPSHLHPHLQLADLIAGSVTAAVAGVPHGLELISLIEPMMCVNWRGIVGGTGLKLFPDKLNNLNHWVLGEDTFARGAGEVSLPYAHWRYSIDDGL
ncbi:DUF3800 domain-containing protein [Microbacterium sp. B19]|uniref:DUF3800 domain-containing protein n=1 Tax=Microbacterium sp. B19 TaxID=96765 RepID=UPI0003B55C08|nr:DUF3800 domain-containing protein [Microbacterium sp. B19]